MHFVTSLAVRFADSADGNVGQSVVVMEELWWLWRNYTHDIILSSVGNGVYIFVTSSFVDLQRVVDRA